jgi:hypothetical protein
MQFQYYVAYNWVSQYYVIITTSVVPSVSEHEKAYIRGGEEFIPECFKHLGMTPFPHSLLSYTLDNAWF